MPQKEGPRVAFRDNDSLAALLAIELKADLLVLLTDVDGLFDGPPADPKSNFIPTYCPEVHDELIKFGDPSQGGRGGMVSKVHLCLCVYLHAILYRGKDMLVENQTGRWLVLEPMCTAQQAFLGSRLFSCLHQAWFASAHPPACLVRLYSYLSFGPKFICLCLH